MKLGRAGSMSDHACEETNRQLDIIIPGIEMFPRSMDVVAPAIESTPTAGTGNPIADSSVINPTSGTSPGFRHSATECHATNEPQPPSVLLHNGMLLIEHPMSKTKGRSSGKKWKNDVEPTQEGNTFSTYNKENYGNKECSGCQVRVSHYITTCPLNLNRSKAAEMRLDKKVQNNKMQGLQEREGVQR
jgi:hypothetical protein